MENEQKNIIGQSIKKVIETKPFEKYKVLLVLFFLILIGGSVFVYLDKKNSKELHEYRNDLYGVYLNYPLDRFEINEQNGYRYSNGEESWDYSIDFVQLPLDQTGETRFHMTISDATNPQKDSLEKFVKGYFPNYKYSITKKINGTEWLISKYNDGTYDRILMHAILNDFVYQLMYSEGDEILQEMADSLVIKGPKKDLSLVDEQIKDRQQRETERLARIENLDEYAESLGITKYNFDDWFTFYRPKSLLVEIETEYYTFKDEKKGGGKPNLTSPFIPIIRLYDSSNKNIARINMYLTSRVYDFADGDIFYHYYEYKDGVFVGMEVDRYIFNADSELMKESGQKIERYFSPMLRAYKIDEREYLIGMRYYDRSYTYFLHFEILDSSYSELIKLLMRTIGGNDAHTTTGNNSLSNEDMRNVFDEMYNL